MKSQNHTGESGENPLQKNTKNKPSVKTFHFKGLTIEIHPEVYEPAEDTFQLIEAVEVKEGDTVLEIGTGCGIVALECARIGAEVICSDLNPHAVKLAKRNYLINKSSLKCSVEIRQGDLFSVLNKDERFDVIIFNPPYLPTQPENRIGGTGWFDIATDGGVNGLELTKRFIDDLSKHLKKTGHAYFVFSSLSDRKKLDEHIFNVGLKSEVMLSRLFNGEQIDIYCIYF
ncbi:MAG: HemK2/MTQ2 family protein methyltransferase [Candidatus Thermoplasmatota archaeon]|nr:HemK2/MTQ2 family protein methyltransferase [Candidatus Thermoplasmatota archaeon]